MTSTRTDFRHIEESTAADWSIISEHLRKHVAGLPKRLAAHLELLSGDFGGFPVDRLTHSLQTATLALRDDRDDEYVACALLHDLGDTLGSWNHPDFAAVVLEPFVSEANHWMVKHHGIFQGYYFFHHLGQDRNMRDRFAGHAHFDLTAEFCALYDGAAFDRDMEPLPLEAFEPILDRVFAKPQRGLYAQMRAE